MPPVPVHIAVLAVARDGAPTQAVSDAATAAGHKIVARATVTDAQNAIRTQLALWIEDPNIDVIVVSGGTESNSASAALKPLISEVLPGFTDLFRYLAFQEIGAGAMHSNAEAARCNFTFVFVLPAAEGAVRAAMEKLILPQLDVKTQPKNLVGAMPRIQNLVDSSAVPTAIVKEKTAGGPGMMSRMPAAATPPRGRPITANTISRRHETSVDDPPTKPIDVAKLEQQIALSESGVSPTKRVDLSRLPKLPPGADDTLDDGEPAPAARPNGRHPRLDSEPIPPPAPASRQLQHTPTRGSGVVKAPPELAASSPASPREIENVASRSAGVAIAKSPSSAPVVSPSTKPSDSRRTPSVAPRTKTEPVAVVPPVRASQPVIAKAPSGPVSSVPPVRPKHPSGPVPAVPVRTKQPSGPVPAVPPRPKTPSGPTATVPEQKVVTIPEDWTYPESGPVPAVVDGAPSGRTKQPSGPTKTPPAPPERAKQPSGPTPVAPPMRTKQPSGPTPVAPPVRTKQPSGPTPVAPPVRTKQASGPNAVVASERTKQPSGPHATPPPPPRAKSPSGPAATAGGRTRPSTDSAALGTQTQSVPIVSPPPGTPLSMRATTDVMEVEDAPSGLDPAAAVRLPPPRRRDDGDMAALVSTPLSRGNDDLPLGEFRYPAKKSNKLGWILALLAMGAIGFGAVVFIVPKLTSQEAASSAPPATPEPPPVVAAVASDAQVAPEVTPDPVPVAEPDPVPETPPTPTNTSTNKTSPTTSKTNPTSTASRPGTKQTPSGTPVTDPSKVAAGSGSQPAEEPEADPPTAPPITDSDCDEVACVLHKYNKPCCEKYRPAESDIKPRAAGGLPTELDKAAVRSGIATVKPAVVACGEKNSDKGTVKIAMTVKPDGSVSDASVASAPSDALGACVATALKKAQFAKTVNGGTFTYPFAF